MSSMSLSTAGATSSPPRNASITQVFEGRISILSMEQQEFASVNYIHTHLQKQKTRKSTNHFWCGRAIKFRKVSYLVNYSQQFFPVPCTKYPPSPPYVLFLSFFVVVIS